MHHSRRGVSFIVFCLLLCGAASPILAETYHVGQQGCDDAGDGAPDRPFCSINRGVEVLQAGDQLVLGDGTYTERVLIQGKRGAQEQAIVLNAAAGAHPVISGVGTSLCAEGFFQVRDSSHISVHGVTIQSSPFFCVAVSRSDHVLLSGLTVSRCEHGGVVFDQGTSYAQLIDSEVSATDQCGPTRGIHEAVTFSDVDYFAAKRNLVHDGLMERIDAKDGLRYGVIAPNDIARMGNVALYLNHVRNVHVFENRVHDGGSSGIQLTVGDKAEGEPETAYNHIYRNEVWNQRHCGLEVWISESAGHIHDNRVDNNLFMRNQDFGVALTDNRAQVYRNALRNNIVVENRMGGIAGIALSQNVLAHNLYHKSGVARGPGAIDADPRLVAPDSGRFELSDGSPAIDSGIDVGLPVISRPDIGPHEFGATEEIYQDNVRRVGNPAENLQSPDWNVFGAVQTTVAVNGPGPLESPGGCSLAAGAAGSPPPGGLVQALLGLGVLVIGARRRWTL